MSPSDLIRHAKIQEEAIGRLSSGVSSETERCAARDAFRQAIWGKGLEAFQGSQLVQRDTSDQVDRVALAGNHLVATIPTGMRFNKLFSDGVVGGPFGKYQM